MRLHQFKKIKHEADRKLSAFITPIDPKVDENRQRYESSLYEFVRGAWPYVEGQTEFHDGWHIRAICEHLEAAFNREIKHLLINIPPRCMKSILLNVMFCCWAWAKDPSIKFLYAAYSQELGLRDSRASLALIQSDWYQQHWGRKFLLTKKNEKLFENNKFGHRMIVTPGGATTGFTGDILVWDDINNARDVDSDLVRTRTNTWINQAFAMRKANPKRSVLIGCQQRLHEEDGSGHLLSKGYKNLVHLCLPMEYEPERACATFILPSTNGKIWKDPRKKEGQLLWPDHFDDEGVENLKLELGTPYAIAGQLQQRPAPADGGIFQRDCFNLWDTPDEPHYDFIIQSWDTALTGDKLNCYSACTTWGIFRDETEIPQLMLLSAVRGQWEYPELREMAQRLARNYNDIHYASPLATNVKNQPTRILIEVKANGYSLLQDLRRAGAYVTKFDPSRYGDKVYRARQASTLVFGERVWLPHRRENYTKLDKFAQEFLEDILLFPNGKSKDYVDSMSQAFMHIKDSGIVYHPTDVRPVKAPDYRVTERYHN